MVLVAFRSVSFLYFPFLIASPEEKVTFGRATPLLQYRVPNIAIASNTRNAKKRVRAGPGRCEVEGSVSVRRFWFCYDIMVMVMAGVIVVVVRSLALALFLIVHSEMTVGFEFREVSYHIVARSQVR